MIFFNWGPYFHNLYYLSFARPSTSNAWPSGANLYSLLTNCTMAGKGALSSLFSNFPNLGVVVITQRERFFWKSYWIWNKSIGFMRTWSGHWTLRTDLPTVVCALHWERGERHCPKCACVPTRAFSKCAHACIKYSLVRVHDRVPPAPSNTFRSKHQFIPHPPHPHKKKYQPEERGQVVLSKSSASVFSLCLWSGGVAISRVVLCTWDRGYGSVAKIAWSKVPSINSRRTWSVCHSHGDKNVCPWNSYFHQV